MKVKFLYDDEWISVVHKPDRLQTHSTRLDPVKDNLMNLLQTQTKQSYYPIHRLDRSTSGVLLVAKKKAFVSLLQNSLQNLPHQKKYVAIVRGPLAKEGTIVREMKDVYSDKVVYSKSTYKLLNTFTAKIPDTKFTITSFSLVELEPITGRTHQLRRHLSKISRPIIGDMVYGDTKLNQFFRKHQGIPHMFLHAYRLSFYHPYIGQKIEVESPLPPYFKDFQNYCQTSLLKSLPSQAPL